MLPLIIDNDDETTSNQNNGKAIFQQQHQQQQQQQQHSSSNLNSNKNLAKLLQIKMSQSTMMADRVDAIATASAMMAAHTNNGKMFLMNNNKHFEHSNTKQKQFCYNNHIIENFIESVQEMNNVVLIPSKLMDLEPFDSNNNGNQPIINDNLYSYYQMINIIKNDLFDSSMQQNNQHYYQLSLNRNTNGSLNDLNNVFNVPKRKLSRTSYQRINSVNNFNTLTNNNNNNNTLLSSSKSHSVSTSNLTSMYFNGNNNTNGTTTSTSSSSSSSTTSSESGVDIENKNSTTTLLSTMNGDGDGHGKCSNYATQLAIEFINHLNSLYTILEHFTQAANLIVERYTNEFEQSV